MQYFECFREQSTAHTGTDGDLHAGAPVGGVHMSRPVTGGSTNNDRASEGMPLFWRPCQCNEGFLQTNQVCIAEQDLLPLFVELRHTFRSYGAVRRRLISVHEEVQCESVTSREHGCCSMRQLQRI